MAAQLLSVNSVGRRVGEMCINWSIQAGNASNPATTPDDFNTPSFPYILGPGGAATKFAHYILNPQSVQAAVNFGEAKTLGLSITRMRRWYDPTGPAYYIPGRIFLNISSCGQNYVIAPNEQGVTDVSTNTLFETLNTLIPIRNSNYAPINIWLEQDLGSGGNPIFPAEALIVASIYNFEIQSPGLLTN